jgi:hypothetical protein
LELSSRCAGPQQARGSCPALAPHVDEEKPASQHRQNPTGQQEVGENLSSRHLVSASRAPRVSVTVISCSMPPPHHYDTPPQRVVCTPHTFMGLLDLEGCCCLRVCCACRVAGRRKWVIHPSPSCWLPREVFLLKCVYVCLLQESAGGGSLQESGSGSALLAGGGSNNSLLQKILTPAPQEFDSGSMRKSESIYFTKSTVLRCSVQDIDWSQTKCSQLFRKDLQKQKEPFKSLRK